MALKKRAKSIKVAIIGILFRDQYDSYRRSKIRRINKDLQKECILHQFYFIDYNTNEWVSDNSLNMELYHHDF